MIIEANKISEIAKDIVRRAGGLFFFYGGFFHLIRGWNNFRGKRLTILVYHRVSTRDIATINYALPFLFISENNFEKQLQFIKRWYRIIDFETLDQCQKAGRLPPNSLIITFDDGYEDNYSIAYGLLKKHGLKACFFIPATRVGARTGKPYWWDRAYSLFRRESETSVKKRGPHQNTLFRLYQTLGSHFFSTIPLPLFKQRAILTANCCAERDIFPECRLFTVSIF